MSALQCTLLSTWQTLLCHTKPPGMVFVSKWTRTWAAEWLTTAALVARGLYKISTITYYYLSTAKGGVLTWHGTNQVDDVVLAVGEVVGGKGQATTDLLLVARVDVAFGRRRISQIDGRAHTHIPKLKGLLLREPDVRNGGVGACVIIIGQLVCNDSFHWNFKK
jgi:hypothetical protein